MPILASLPVILDLLCIIHVYRTGRPLWWYLVIIMFPMLGALAYLFLEVLPKAGGTRVVKRVIKVIDPGVDLKSRIREVERCGSAANKAALADELINVGQFDDAIELFQSCLVGLHADQPSMIFGLAEAYFYKRDGANALATPWLSTKPSLSTFLAKRLAAATCPCLPRLGASIWPKRCCPKQKSVPR